MFEGLVVSLLNKYLGEYLENLDKDSLGISIRQGLVDLRDVKVRGEALDFLQLPVSVKYGRVGHIQISVSWTKLSTVPVVITLEDVYVVAAPVGSERRAKDAAAQAERLNQKLVQERLDSLNAWELLKFPGSGEDEKEQGYAAKLAERIVDNIQVVVKRVHLQFEYQGDPSNDPSAPSFTLGLAVEELSAYSTDGKWNRLEKSVEDPPTVYRDIQVKGLAVYLNRRQRTVAGAASTVIAPGQASIVIMSPAPITSVINVTTGSVPENAAPPEDVFAAKPLLTYRHLVPPIFARNQLTMHKRSHQQMAAASEPRVVSSLHVERLGLAIEQSQYRDAMLLLSSLSSQPPADLSLSAASESAELKIKAPSTSYRPFTDSERDEYVHLYKRKFAGYKRLSDIEQARLTELESSFSFQDVLRLRNWSWSVASHELNKPMDQVEMHKKITTGWFTSWWNSKPKETDVPLISSADLAAIYANDPTARLTADEKALLASLPRPYVMLQITARLDELFVALLNELRTPLVAFSLTSGVASYSQRPDSMLVRLGMQSVQLRDHITLGTQFPLLLGNANSNATTVRSDVKQAVVKPVVISIPASPWVGQSSSVLSIEFESNPIDPSLEADARISVEANAVDMVYNQGVLNRVMEFFKPPEQVDVGALKSIANERLQSLRLNAQARLYEAMKRRSRTFMDVKARAPTLIIPADATDANGTLLVLDLGAFRVETVLQPLAEHKQNMEALLQQGAASNSETGQPASSDPDTALEAVWPKAATSLERTGDHGGDGAWSVTLKHQLEAPLLKQLRFYDMFAMRGIDMKVFLATGGSSWRTVSSNSKHPDGSPPTVVELVQPFAMDLRLLLSIAPFSSALPTLKVYGRLLDTQLVLSTSGVRRLMQLVRSVTASSATSRIPVVDNLPLGIDPPSGAAASISLATPAPRPARVSPARPPAVQSAVAVAASDAVKTAFLGQFTMSRVRISFVHDEDAASSRAGRVRDTNRKAMPIMLMDVSGATVRTIKRTCDLTVVAALSGVEIEDQVFAQVHHLSSTSEHQAVKRGAPIPTSATQAALPIADHSDWFRKLVSTQAESSRLNEAAAVSHAGPASVAGKGKSLFAHIVYSYVQPNSPFYQQSDQSVQATFGTPLSVSLNHESLPYLATFFLRDFMNALSGSDHVAHASAAVRTASTEPQSAVTSAPHPVAAAVDYSLAELTCAACDKLLSDRKTFRLACGHVYCEACVRQYSASPAREIQASFTCVHTECHARDDPPAMARPIPLMMSIKVHFHSLNLRLNAQRNRLAEAYLTGFDASYLYNAFSTNIMVSLARIGLDDLIKNNANPHLARLKSNDIAWLTQRHVHVVETVVDLPVQASGAVAKPLVTISYSALNSALPELFYPDPTASKPRSVVKASVEGLRFCVLMRFVNEMLAFPTQVMGVMAAITKKRATEQHRARIKASSSVLSAPHIARDLSEGSIASRVAIPNKPVPFAFMKLAVTLHRIELVIPRSSVSDDVMIARVENISVSNALCGIECRGLNQQSLAALIKSSSSQPSTPRRPQTPRGKPSAASSIPALTSPRTGAQQPTASSPAELFPDVDHQAALQRLTSMSASYYSAPTLRRDLSSNTDTDATDDDRDVFEDAVDYSLQAFQQYVIRVGAFITETRFQPVGTMHMHGAGSASANKGDPVKPGAPLDFILMPTVTVVASQSLARSTAIDFAVEQRQMATWALDVVSAGINVIVSAPQVDFIMGVLYENLTEKPIVLQASSAQALKESASLRARNVTMNAVSRAMSGATTPALSARPSQPATPRSIASHIDLHIETGQDSPRSSIAAGGSWAAGAQQVSPAPGTAGSPAVAPFSVVARFVLQRFALQLVTKPLSASSPSMALVLSSAMLVETMPDGTLLAIGDVTDLKAVNAVINGRADVAVLAKQIAEILAHRPEALILAPFSVNYAFEYGKSYLLIRTLRLNTPLSSGLQPLKRPATLPVASDRSVALAPTPAVNDTTATASDSVLPRSLFGQLDMGPIRLRLTYQSYRLLWDSMGALIVSKKPSTATPDPGDTPSAATDPPAGSSGSFPSAGKGPSSKSSAAVAGPPSTIRHSSLLASASRGKMVPRTTGTVGLYTPAALTESESRTSNALMLALVAEEPELLDEDKYDDQAAEQQAAVASLDAAAMARSKLDLEVKARDLPLASYGEQDIVLRFRGVDVQIINDAAVGSEWPLAALRMHEVTTRISAFAQQRTINAGLRMHADYYNQRAGVWEPMLEPWRLKIDIIQTITAKRPSGSLFGTGSADINAASANRSASSSAAVAVIPRSTPTDLPLFSKASANEFVEGKPISYDDVVVTDVSIVSEGELNVNLTRAMADSMSASMAILTSLGKVDPPGKTSTDVSSKMVTVQAPPKVDASSEEKKPSALSASSEDVEDGLSSHVTHRVFNATDLQLDMIVRAGPETTFSTGSQPVANVSSAIGAARTSSQAAVWDDESRTVIAQHLILPYSTQSVLHASAATNATSAGMPRARVGTLRFPGFEPLEDVPLDRLHNSVHVLRPLQSVEVPSKNTESDVKVPDLATGAHTSDGGAMTRTDSAQSVAQSAMSYSTSVESMQIDPSVDMGKRSQLMVIEVAVVDGVKLLSVHSAYKVFNHTSTEMECFGHIIPREGSLWVPLAFTAASSFCLRPANKRVQSTAERAQSTSSADYEYCSPIELHPSKALDMFVTCKAGDRDLTAGAAPYKGPVTDFYLCLETAFVLITENHYYTHFHLRAPLVIENLLCSTAYLRVLQMELPRDVLTVRLHAGRQLGRADVIGKSDPFCVIYWRDDKSFPDKHSTSKVMRNTLNPNWNEIFHFAWPSAALQAKGAAGVANARTLVLDCFDEDPVGRDFLGRAEIDLDQIRSLNPHNPYISPLSFDLAGAVEYPTSKPVHGTVVLSFIFPEFLYQAASSAATIRPGLAGPVIGSKPVHGSPASLQPVTRLNLWLQRGRELHLHSCDPSLPSLLAVRVPSFNASSSARIGVLDGPATDALWSSPVDLTAQDVRRNYKVNVLQFETRDVVLTDPDGRTLTLRLELMEIDSDMRGGMGARPRRAVLYAPYWLFDFTDLRLVVKLDKKTAVAADSARRAGSAAPALTAAGAAAAASVAQDDAALLRRAQMFGGPSNVTKEVFTRASYPALSQWSQGFSLDTIGFIGSTTMRGADESLYEIGIQVSAGSGAFRRTNMVMFTPRFLIVNNLPLPIQIKQHAPRLSPLDYGVNTVISSALDRAGSQINLGPAAGKAGKAAGGMVNVRWLDCGAVGAFHWPSATNKSFVAFRTRSGAKPISAVDAAERPGVSDLERGSDWSGYFSLSEIGDIGVMVRNSKSGESFIARIETVARGPSMLITISPDHPAAPPFRIENRCSYDSVRFSQKDVNKWETLKPFTACPYAWDELSLPKELSVCVLGDRDQEYSFPLDKPGDLEDIPLSSPVPRRLYVYMQTDGPTKVLVISDYPQYLALDLLALHGGAPVTTASLKDVAEKAMEQSAKSSKDQARSAASGAYAFPGVHHMSRGRILLDRYALIRTQRDADAARLARARRSLNESGEVKGAAAPNAKPASAAVVAAASLVSQDDPYIAIDAAQRASTASDRKDVNAPAEPYTGFSVGAADADWEKIELADAEDQAGAVSGGQADIGVLGIAARDAMLSEGDGSGSACLIVDVIEAQHLAAVKLGGSSNPYIVVTFNSQQQRTPIMKSTTNPWFNHRMIFRCPNPLVRRDKMPPLKVAVFSENWLLSDDFLGGVRIVELERLFDKAPSSAAALVQADMPAGDAAQYVRQKWFRLDPLRQNDKLQGDVHLRIQWVDSRSRVVEQEIAELEHTMEARDRSLAILTAFHDSDLRSGEEERRLNLNAVVPANSSRQTPAKAVRACASCFYGDRTPSSAAASPPSPSNRQAGDGSTSGAAGAELGFSLDNRYYRYSDWAPAARRAPSNTVAASGSSPQNVLRSASLVPADAVRRTNAAGSKGLAASTPQAEEHAVRVSLQDVRFDLGTLVQRLRQSDPPAGARGSGGSGLLPGRIVCVVTCQGRTAATVLLEEDRPSVSASPGGPALALSDDSKLPAPSAGSAFATDSPTFIARVAPDSPSEFEFYVPLPTQDPSKISAVASRAAESKTVLANTVKPVKLDVPDDTTSALPVITFSCYFQRDPPTAHRVYRFGSDQVATVPSEATATSLIPGSEAALTIRQSTPDAYVAIGEYTLSLADVEWSEDAGVVVPVSNSKDVNGSFVVVPALDPLAPETTVFHTGRWFKLRRSAAPSAVALVSTEDEEVRSESIDAWIHVDVRKRKPLPPQFRPHTLLSLAVPLFGVSVVDSTPRELFYFSMEGSSVVLEESIGHRTAEVTINHLQLDHQTPNALFPVVIRPKPSNPDGSGVQHGPFMEVQMQQRKSATASYPVTLYPIASVQLQPLEIRIEEALLWLTLAFLNEFGAQGLSGQRSGMIEPDEQPIEAVEEVDQAADGVIVRSVMEVYSAPPPAAGKMFFSTLQLNIAGLELSFEGNPAVRRKYQGLTFNPLAAVLNVAGAAFTRLENAPMPFDPLVLNDAFGNFYTLLVPIYQFYTRQLISKAYLLLGSFAFLGNPVQVARNVGTGFKDLGHGLLSVRKEGARGVARGARSLFAGAATGIFGAAANITGSAGKGLATLLDKEYQDKRESEARKVAAQPNSATTAIASGLKSGVTGVAGGITGLILDPLRGAKEDGVKGFFSGAGKGLVGLVVKPGVGVIDMTSRAFAGIRNAAAIAQGPLTTARKARFIPLDGRLSVFDRVASECQDELVRHPIKAKVVSSAAKEQERYLFHIVFSPPDPAVVSDGGAIPAPAVVDAKRQSRSLLVVSTLRLLYIVLTEAGDEIFAKPAAATGGAALPGVRGTVSAVEFKQPSPAPGAKKAKVVQDTPFDVLLGRVRDVTVAENSNVITIHAEKKRSRISRALGIGRDSKSPVTSSGAPLPASTALAATGARASLSDPAGGVAVATGEHSFEADVDDFDEDGDAVGAHHTRTESTEDDIKQADVSSTVERSVVQYTAVDYQITAETPALAARAVDQLRRFFSNVLVLHAEYGAIGVKSRDVTHVLMSTLLRDQKLLLAGVHDSDGFLVAPARPVLRSTGALFHNVLFGDPYPNHTKSLLVTYSINFTLKTKQIQQDDSIVLD